MTAEADMTLRHVRDIRYRLLPSAERRTTDIVIERDGEISVRRSALGSSR